MAKRGTVTRQTRFGSGRAGARSSASAPDLSPAPDRTIVDYTEEIGRMIGGVRARVDNWSGDREQLIEQLSVVVDDAQHLLSDLGHRAEREVQRLASRGRAATGTVADARPRRKGGKATTRRKTGARGK